MLDRKYPDIPANIIIQTRRRAAAFLWVFLLIPFACNKFVDPGAPPDKIITSDLFKTDASATSAVVGIYSQINGFGLNILSGSTTIYAGLASDELLCNRSGSVKEFQTNSIATTNYYNLLELWRRAYQFIYQANACIEGITESNEMSEGAKKQLLGECKVTRSLVYFYLVQLYGDVPLIISPDYNLSSVQERTPVKEVYNRILNDLTEAKSMLTETYPSPGRMRPNLYTALALLARTNLFLGNWKAAEEASSAVIESKKYNLLSDPNKVFLNNSEEVIWQVINNSTVTNTQEGSEFVKANPSTIPNYLITDQLLASFERGDIRQTSWVGQKILNNKTYYFPYKYKIPSKPNNVLTESYTMFRLAEQLLIRAEARIQQGQTDEGIKDLNMLRARARGGNSANLPDYPMGTTKEQALSYVLQERKTELFAEWGHRWLDLKRYKLAGIILRPVKPAWQDTDTLFPIPAQEITLNNKLIQNNGY